MLQLNYLLMTPNYTYMVISYEFSASRMESCLDYIASTGNYKMLSYRRETALQGALVLAKVEHVEDWNWETIFYGYYGSIFNHCDIGLQNYRIR